MSCHGNHAFLQSQKRLFVYDGLVSHLGGPNEKFDTHEKLSLVGLHGTLNWHPDYKDMLIFIKGGFDLEILEYL